MNRNEDEETPSTDIIDDVPPSLRKVGLTKITTNLSEGQSLRLPTGLIMTFFKGEIIEGLAKRAREIDEKQKEAGIMPLDTTNSKEEKP